MNIDDLDIGPELKEKARACKKGEGVQDSRRDAGARQEGGLQALRRGDGGRERWLELRRQLLGCRL